MMSTRWAALLGLLALGRVEAVEAAPLEYSGTITDAEIKSSPDGFVPIGIDGDTFHYFSQGYLVVPPFSHYDGFFDATYNSDGTFVVSQYGSPGTPLAPSVVLDGNDLKIDLPFAGAVHADFTGESAITFDLDVTSVVPVPLPASSSLLGVALLGLGALAFGRRARG